MKTGAVVQARTSSTRLPHKVLKELPCGSGVTVLQQVIRRLKKSKKLDEVIVATTVDEADGRIVELSEKENVKWFKGSIDDVLERYYLAASENDLDVIIRVTSDCPCIDPEIVDSLIEEHIRVCADYTSNCLVRTYPHGLDVEVLNFAALAEAHREAKNSFEREHVCPYIYKTRPQAFKIQLLEAPKNLAAPDIRITLDTQEDYVLLCAVFDFLCPRNHFFTAGDIIGLFVQRPWLKLINRKVLQKKIFDTLEEELAETVRLLELQDLKRAKEYVGKLISR